MKEKETENRTCCGCDEPTSKEDLQRVGLVWLCPYCIAERDALQSIQPPVPGRCEGDL